MRHIAIHRERRFLFAIFVTCWCVFDFQSDRVPLKKRHISSSKGRLFFKNISEPIQAIPIKNGQTIVVELDDQAHEFFVLYRPEPVVSNKIIIPAGCSNLSYSIKIKGGLEVGYVNIVVDRTG